jgi:hypothetical protein
MKLNKYLIYKHKEYPKIVIIRDAFSFSAGIFGEFWLLYHKIWDIALFLLLISMIIFTIVEIDIKIVRLISFLSFGFLATDILEWHYKRHGYLLENIIYAYSEEEAEISFMKQVYTNGVAANV